MATDLLATLRSVSDGTLTRQLQELVRHERGTIAEVLAHIAELDTREIHLGAGYGSLFAYCRDALCNSEAEAYNRVEAARAARRFPVILEMLEEGSINLTTIRLLGRHLTPENHRSVLEAARGRKKTEVEEIMVGLWPRPDAPSVIRKLPAGAVAAVSVPVDGARPFWPASPASMPTGVAPLAPDRYKVQFTIGVATLEKLRRAKDMLRHAIPTGDEATILDRALTVLLADLARKKFGATDHPRPAPTTAPGSRHVPAEVRRAVWQRDASRCAFVADAGRRCAERGMLEFHHVEPYAIGGEATVENVELRCRRHNGYEAKVYFETSAPPGGRGPG